MKYLGNRFFGTAPVVLNPEDAAHTARLLSLLNGSNSVSDLGRIPKHNERTELAKKIYDARRARDEFFPSELFADPAWDILLTLYWAQGVERVSVSSVCAAAGVPSTTALRWIENLRSVGLVRKTPHPTDARVHWVELTEDAMEKLDHYLSKLLDHRNPGSPTDADHPR